MEGRRWRWTRRIPSGSKKWDLCKSHINAVSFVSTHKDLEQLEHTFQTTFLQLYLDGVGGEGGWVHLVDMVVLKGQVRYRLGAAAHEIRIYDPGWKKIGSEGVRE